MNKKNTTPITEPAGGWPADQYTGVGGSYVRDPVTGLRSPAPSQAEAAIDETTSGEKQ